MFQRHQWPDVLLKKDDARRKQLHGIRRPFATDKPVKPYDGKAVAEKRSDLPRDGEMVPRFVSAHSRSGCRMSPAKRAMVVARADARHAFFAGLTAEKASI